MSNYTIPLELLNLLSSKDSYRAKWTPFNSMTGIKGSIDTKSNRHLIALAVLSNLK